ncbi:MAG: cytochrome P450 [Pseudonocardiaceae bacterium]
MGEARDFDLIESYARPVPIAVIGELLGVPENGRVQVGIWSKIIFSDVSKTDRVHASNELLLFLKDLISARPVEASCGILRELLDAASGADRLSPPEIVSMIALLLVAGHETTMNLIANASRLLLLAPGLASRIVSNPTLISGAVEEFLRFDGPVNVATMRHTVRPTVIGDVEIPAGELVLLALASANRDASKFQAPDVINIGREQRNLAFGHGVHHCIGAPLARLEGTIAILRLMERFPHLHLAVDESVLRWRGSILMRGLESLPVSIRAHSESADERLEL